MKVHKISWYSPTYMGSKRTTLGKAYGTKWGAIGNMLENTLGAWVTYWELNWEFGWHIGNLMETHWELKIPKTWTHHYPSQEEKKWIYWVCAAIHHWLSKISIINCVHHLFWPRVMVGAWIEFWGHSNKLCILFNLIANITNSWFGHLKCVHL
jgi:hypothetical protein